MENKQEELSPKEEAAFASGLPANALEKATPEAPKPETTMVNKSALDKLIAKVDALEEKSKKDDKKLDMLEYAADKGRVFNYKNRQVSDRLMTVKLSIHDDKYVVAWRNAYDIIKYHPMTGLPTGEEQQIEIILLDKDGKTAKEMINSYQAFSDIKYAKRVDCQIMSKKQDFKGNWTYDIKLPDGRIISLDQAFLN